MRLAPWLLFSLLVACKPEEEGGPEPFTFAEPDAGPAWRGPGGPSRSFEEAELFEACGALMGSEADSFDHRNLVMPYRGHLVLPWSPEWGSGGVVLYDVSDPCAPAAQGELLLPEMRETHAIGMVHLREGEPHAGDYAVVNAKKGIQIVDLTDPLAMKAAGQLDFEGSGYPDAYARVPLSVSVVYPYVYAAVADVGVFVVDMTDPYAPKQVGHYVSDPPLRAGGVFAFGTTLLVTAAKEVEQEILDISDPARPRPLLGGRFTLADGDGQAVDPYHSNRVGPYGLFARKSRGGGPLIWDLSNPQAPAFEAGIVEATGSGGYLFWDEGFVFQGEGSFGQIYDFRDITAPVIHHRVELEGDFDTLVPYGNVVVAGVDEGAVDGVGQTLVPWQTAPDSAAPVVWSVSPADGEEGVAITTCLGVGFNEPIEPSAVFAGSVRLSDEDGDAVDGWGSGQEATAHFCPKEPLKPGTVYTLEVPAGGIPDLNGNPVAVPWTSTFRTAG